MLPRPRFLALIALEAVERDDERSLRTLRAKAGVDVVELARGGGHRHGGGHALREAVVIGRRAERARPVRFGQMIAGEQIDEVEVGSVGEHTHTEPPEREHAEFAETGRTWSRG